MKYVEKINKRICFLWVAFAMFCLVVSFEKEVFSQAGTNQPEKKVEEPKKEQPALGIDGPRFVYQGKSITYTIAMINITKEILKDVILRAEIPLGFQWLSATGIFIAGKPGPVNLTWRVLDLEPGQTRTYSFELLAKSTGTFIITAEGSTSSTRDFPVKASITTKVRAVPAVHISTYDTEDPVQVGKQTTYVVEIRNEGTAPCTNIKIESKIPEQMEFVSAAANVSFKNKGNTVTFDAVPILQPGEKLYLPMTSLISPL
ncbi:MAG: DUF11 domain-containing protein [Nitrospirae bacterium]|nr:DUF11 domain-containing protein [Nitrospirota bacterium]